MNYSTEYEGIEWPAGMQIRVAFAPESLLELLWIRHAAVAGARPDLPAADLAMSAPESGSPDLIFEWETSWTRTLEHVRRLHELPADEVDTHEELWNAPSFAGLARRADTTLGEPFRTWQSRLVNNIGAEYAATDELRLAWTSGLRLVIEIPVVGEFSAKLSPTTLLVSSRSRNDPMAYLRALMRFGWKG